MFPDTRAWHGFEYHDHRHDEWAKNVFMHRIQPDISLCVAWWLSGRALDLQFTGRGFNPGRSAQPQLSLASLRCR